MTYPKRRSAAASPPAVKHAKHNPHSDSSDSDSSDGSEYAVKRPVSDSPAWQETVQRVVKSVVSIHFAQVAPFDVDAALGSEATGFVVDAVRGIILTNRHVVGAGPFWGYAVFDNHEEVEVRAIYRDPVHDFGFLQFDPAAVKHMPVQALELHPHRAQVGVEIRVVGNDAGEKLSILAGFISRLDRNAPEYGHMTYNDFNTEYIQAAAAASGGSSGLPVVDIDGHAVALQAGGSSESATDFFLPVYRVQRALECLQRGEPVTRGTIQTQWMLLPYDECRRLGLSAEAESEARAAFPGRTGMLVAEVVLPEGPAAAPAPAAADSSAVADSSAAPATAAGILEGDILLRLNNTPISSFIDLDATLDTHVGAPVDLVLQRGGVTMALTLTVGDLHAITPNRYLEVCGALFNDLSYQMARLYAIPVRGVFASHAAGSFTLHPALKCGWLIDAVDDRDTPDLDAFIAVMLTIPDRARVPVTYRHLTDMHTPCVAVVCIDRHWTRALRTATRNDATGVWDFATLQSRAPAALPLVPRAARFVDVATEAAGCARLARSFVLVSTRMPVGLDAHPHARARAHGLVIDAARGLVLVSRFVVPHDLCDVDVTVADLVIVPATVCFLHPLHNYAVVRYDPALVLAPVETPVFGAAPLAQGDRVHFVGFNRYFRAVAVDTRVADIAALSVNSASSAPRYRATNLETVQLETTVASDCAAGVVADADGTVRAVWMSFLGEGAERETVHRAGVDVCDLLPVVRALQAGAEPCVRIVDCEFVPVALAQARLRGVPEEWIARAEEAGGANQFQFLAVSRAACPLPGAAASELQEGDIVLAADGVPVYRVRDLDAGTRTTVAIELLRRKQVRSVVVRTAAAADYATNHQVLWCGASFQAPHHGVRQLMKRMPSGVYCTGRAAGSPARHYGLDGTNFVTHVGEQPTPDLEAFARAVRAVPDNTYVKLRIVSFDHIPFARSCKTNYHYFPTLEMRREGNEWRLIEDDVEE